MASLQKHRVGGHTYWRIVESRRINGKPRAVPILQLGTADALFNRLLASPGGPLRVRSYEHGSVAALKAAADRLDIATIIDRHVPTRKQQKKLSVGTTLVLAAINRAVRPRSKRAWAAWAEGTSLRHLYPKLNVQSMTSQFFWDQMHRVTPEALRRIEGELAKKVVAELDIKLDTLLYDATNFFTYIASTNDRPKLPKRGHSKQKRVDLRIFSLALLVSRDGEIPLYSRVYEGNRVDCKSFPESLTAIRERLAELSLELDDLTVVYDRGNLSKENQALVDGAPFGYVAALTPAHHKDLVGIPVAEYGVLPKGSPLAGTPVLRLTRTIWGAERTVLLTISDRLRQGQIRGLQQHLAKRLKQLAEWKEQLSKPRSGPRSTESAQKQINKLLMGQHIKSVLKIDYNADRQGSDRLDYQVDQQVMDRLTKEVFGKRILVTNRSKWSDEEILVAYRGQADVEHTFRQLKDDEHLAVRPQYHWTDQKIQVHTFICLLGLMLARVVEREARRLHRREGLSGILDILAKVRLAMVIHASGEKGGRPRCDWQLEDGDQDALELFTSLVPREPPLVYTSGQSRNPRKQASKR